MIAEQVNDDGTVFFRVFVKPLVNLIWLAGLVFVLGSRDRPLAGRARGAPARDPLRAGRRARRQPRGHVSLWLLLGAAARRRRASSWSRCRSCASPSPSSDELDELTRPSGSGSSSRRSAIGRSPR